MTLYDNSSDNNFEASDEPQASRPTTAIDSNG